MKINQNEISSIELLGILDGQDIKLVKLKGGLNLAIGRDTKGGETVLAAASHPAILSYNMEKNHPNFHSALLKNENSEKPQADKHSHFLTDDLRKSGHDVYSIQNGNVVEFYLTRHDLKVESIPARLEGGELIFKSCEFFSGPLGSVWTAAICEKSLSCGAKKVRIEG